MQCPACNHIPLAGNQPDPNACPKCGVEYSASIRAQADKAWQGKERAEAQRRAIDAVSPEVRAAMQGYKGAQPVVVLDINMSFGSMVRLLVKLAFAAIPAAIIVTVIVWGLISILGVVGFMTR